MKGKVKVMAKPQTAQGPQDVPSGPCLRQRYWRLENEQKKVPLKGALQLLKVNMVIISEPSRNLGRHRG